MARNIWFAAAVILSASAPANGEPIVFETHNLRLTIAEDGTVQSLISIPTGKEYACEEMRIPFATVYRGGRSVPSSQKRYGEVTARWVYHGGQVYPATRAVRQGDQLRVEFADARTTATFRVILKPEYLALELQTMEGESVDRIDWLCLNLVDLPNRGAWVNFAFGDQFGVCLCAGNVRTNAEMDQAADSVTLRVVAEREVGLEGTTAVLFGCTDPRNRFLDVMAVVERDFGMPVGAENRRKSGQRLSYLWASRPTPENIDEYIRLAKRGGFHVIMFSYTSFSTGAGHFKWIAAYPNGMADLKKVTDAIRQAGLKVGLHIHYSKASKADAYVTPVPDVRLHLVREFTLADTMDTGTNTIPVRENPAGCTLDTGRRILKIGEELVAYEDYRSKPPFAFTGCERGNLGTAATGHARGERLGLLDVDTWPIFVRFDQQWIWENVVSNRGLTPVQRRILADRREHHLFLNEQGDYELVQIAEVSLEGTAVKTYSFQRASRPKDTYVLIWAVENEVEPRLPVAGKSIRAMRPFGTEMPVGQLASASVTRIAGRSYLAFADLTVDETTRILAESLGSLTAGSDDPAR